VARKEATKEVKKAAMGSKEVLFKTTKVVRKVFRVGIMAIIKVAQWTTG